LHLTLADWAAIVGYLLITSCPGVVFPARSGQSTEGLLCFRQKRVVVAGGNVDGGDHVAADTPLAVTGLVYVNGVAGNWLWWSFFAVGDDDVFLVREIVEGAPD